MNHVQKTRKNRWIALLLITIFILSQWIYSLYNQIDQANYDIKLNKIYIKEKDSVSYELMRTLDSMSKVKNMVIIIQKESNKYYWEKYTPKIDTVQFKDTVTIN